MTAQSIDDRIDEVVVGLASEREVARIEELARNDAGIARKLERARMRFHALDETAGELPLPERMWERIARDIAELPAKTDGRTASGEVVELAPLRKSVLRWRAAALSGMAAAMLLAAMLGWTINRSTEPVVIAVLLNDTGKPVAVVEGTANNTTLVTLLEIASASENQVMQVWTKPDDNGPPVSIGLLPMERSRTFEVEGLPPPRADQLYEITLEPMGGSPTNLPTGPILGKGFARQPIL